jgi:hypothetical protein
MPFVIDRVSLPKTKKIVTVLCRAGLKYFKKHTFPGVTPCLMLTFEKHFTKIETKMATT